MHQKHPRAALWTFFPEVWIQALSLLVGNKSLHVKMDHVIYMKGTPGHALCLRNREKCVIRAVQVT